MSGAVTNTPGPQPSAQAAARDLQLAEGNSATITLAYAVAYPFAVIGIILSLLILKRILGINIDNERELHRKLGFIQSARPLSVHIKLENKQLIGQPLRRVIEMLNEPVIISRCGIMKK